jgi:hypothetical protein
MWNKHEPPRQKPGVDVGAVPSGDSPFRIVGPGAALSGPATGWLAVTAGLSLHAHNVGRLWDW